jgi:hypothetical protein
MDVNQYQKAYTVSARFLKTTVKFYQPKALFPPYIIFYKFLGFKSSTNYVNKFWLEYHQEAKN